MLLTKREFVLNGKAVKSTACRNAAFKVWRPLSKQCRQGLPVLNLSGSRT